MFEDGPASPQSPQSPQSQHDHQGLTTADKSQDKAESDKHEATHNSDATQRVIEQVPCLAETSSSDPFEPPGDAAEPTKEKTMENEASPAVESKLEEPQIPKVVVDEAAKESDDLNDILKASIESDNPKEDKEPKEEEGKEEEAKEEEEEGKEAEQKEEVPEVAPLPPRSSGAPPALPPRSHTTTSPPPLPPRKRMPFFWLRGKSQSSISSIDHVKSKRSSVASADYDLLLYRLDANNQELQTRDSAERDASLSGIRQLQQNFQAFRETKAEAEADTQVDWELWSNVINDYSNFARKNPTQLSSAIASGFPEELRGIIWQLIASSKSSTLEEVYASIVNEPCPHEKAIKRDIARTSFVKNANSNSLFKIIKAYSLFDPEVGYTQGMAFIAVPLLLNMQEQEAFCLLVHLMKDYGLRQMFLTDMPGLHLRLYQFDRLLEDTVPDVHTHLARQGVRSSMYASQWFLTLFSYKFPLQLVLRIFDIVIAEGVESLLRFGVALMKRNSVTIMSLEFDAVLPFLKEQIFDYYVVGSENGEVQYSDELVSDAYQVKLLPVTLNKYEKEYEEIHRIERERVEEVESLRTANGNLTLQVRRLETSLATLNQEHIQIANEMVQGKLEIARLQDENERATGELAELKEANEKGKVLADQELCEEMAALREENESLKAEKEKATESVNALEKELVDTKMKLANLDDAHSKLLSRWQEIKKHMSDM
ncbi:GTPase-activating protein Gyp5p [Trichomonascus vanleenenianus]|uniref:GTPase-activating protein Gyp5p n=1 Tax=Trichomonascus vanleenenianus TaxID=2268995 RepID=UPI003ECA11B2